MFIIAENYFDLQPFLPLKEKKHNDGNGDHYSPKDIIGVRIFQKWHIFEIHAVDTDDKGEGNEDRRKDSQHFHNVVDIVADAGIVAVLLIGYHGVVNLYGFEGLGDQAFEVAEIIIGTLVDYIRIRCDKTSH